MITFKCQQCGECCTKLAAKDGRIALRLLPEEAKHFPKETVRRRGSGHYELFVEPCPMLEANRCRIYADRPLVCRMWPLQKNFILKGCKHLKKGVEYAIDENMVMAMVEFKNKIA